MTFRLRIFAAVASALLLSGLVTGKAAADDHRVNLTGRIVDNGGSTIPNAMVLVTRIGTAPETFTTDEKGRFKWAAEMNSLGEPIELYVRAEGHMSVFTDLKLRVGNDEGHGCFYGSDSVDVVLERVDLAEKPTHVGDFEVQLEPIGGQSRTKQKI